MPGGDDRLRRIGREARVGCCEWLAELRAKERVVRGGVRGAATNVGAVKRSARLRLISLQPTLASLEEARMRGRGAPTNRLRAFAR